MIGAEIQQIRLANHLSQEELGNQQFSAAYISRVENGLQEPSRRFLDHVATKLRYHSQEFYAPGRDGHLLDSLLHLSQKMYDLANTAMTDALLEQALCLADKSGDPLVMAWVLGFRLSLGSHGNNEQESKFWDIVDIVDWDRVTPEDTVRFVKMMKRFLAQTQGDKLKEPCDPIGQPARSTTARPWSRLDHETPRTTA